MEIQFTVEYIDENGEDQYIDNVELFGEPRWDNPSFSYSGSHCTHGQDGICELPSYTTMDDSDVTWDKTLYTDSQNEIIQKWVTEKTDYIEGKFCRELEKQSNPEYDQY